VAAQLAAPQDGLSSVRIGTIQSVMYSGMGHPIVR
jgi:hypothetical protein